MAKTLFLAVLDRQNKILAPICTDGAFCSQRFPLRARGAVLAVCPHSPARVSVSEYSVDAFPGLWWPLLAHSALPQAAVCSTAWPSARMRTGTPLPHCPIPAAPALHRPCTSSYQSLQYNGRAQWCITRKITQLFLSQTSLKKWLVSPLITSPLDKFTKYPKKHHSNRCCCCPQYSHARLGAYFSLQPKGKSNKLLKKINYFNGSHRRQWQRKI